MFVITGEKYCRNKSCINFRDLSPSQNFCDSVVRTSAMLYYLFRALRVVGVASNITFTSFVKINQDYEKLSTVISKACTFPARLKEKN
jgi:hypothetical protein